ncbi:MAG: double-strand break repair protein AddB [Pseudomonadota bacterium]
MFNKPGPRMFGTAPGVDFPRALIRGLETRLQGRPPEAWARVTLYVNTRRMQRRIQELFAEGPPRLLPRIRLITTPDDGAIGAAIPQAVPSLEVRLELRQLLARLLDAEPDLAPRSALFDLADSLASLMDEMRGEGISPAALHRIDVADHAIHWGRSLRLIDIVVGYLQSLDRPFGGDDRLRQMALALQSHWQTRAPQDPILVAGSTGSRGATRLFMSAVARLPQGALILPGYDFDQPAGVWSALGDAMSGEDHPQYRFRQLMLELDLEPSQVSPWSDLPAPHANCNRLISLALRPAPVTDQWRSESRELPDLAETTRHISLVEAPSPREEAAAIALAMRQALENGKTTALITPDRMLTRQVTAALDRWSIIPDDSAGRPLNQTAPGRFLRQIAAAMARPLRLDQLLALLKHPLTCSGELRGDHLRWTRELELDLRRRGHPYPTPAHAIDWLGRQKTPPDAWVKWLSDILLTANIPGDLDLGEHIESHLALAEAVARGPSGEGSGALWDAAAGETARATMQDLTASAGSGGIMSHRDYVTLVTGVLSGKEVREAQLSHPKVMIWGTLEARVQGADVVILGGLNDGSWPELPAPDPWLSRPMRLQAGLLLPERRIGLAAHDFQQSIAAREVILSRSVRDSEAETVPSRWLNRLSNLMRGTSAQGQAAFGAMQARGDQILQTARLLDRPLKVDPLSPRPSPRPPAAARPKELPVTAITTLIRDPYEIYAKYILRLRALQPMLPEPDNRLKGNVLHRVMGRVIRTGHPLPPCAAAALTDQLQALLAESVPWPATARLWEARFLAVLPDLIERERRRAERGIPVLDEKTGAAGLPGLDFTLTARPDRIDRRKDGSFAIFDYKTGSPPSLKEVDGFEKQLTLEAALLSQGAFQTLGPGEVAEMTYIALSKSGEDRSIKPYDDNGNHRPDITWQGLIRLIGHYAEQGNGFTARRAIKTTDWPGDYDHLSRLGEWSDVDVPQPEDVGR